LSLMFDVLGGIATHLSTKVDDALMDHNPTHALFGFFALDSRHFLLSLWYY
jgi:hypothetical protein